MASLNYVSRPEDKPLILTTVDHATFSPDGLWLATVSWTSHLKGSNSGPCSLCVCVCVCVCVGGGGGGGGGGVALCKGQHGKWEMSQNV